MGQNSAAESMWPRRVFKAFGLLHIAFAAFGLYLVALAAYGLTTRGYFTRPIDPSAPYKKEFYFARTAINLAFLGGLTYAGISLLRGRSQAVRINNILFGLLITYFFGSVWVGGNGPIGMSNAATGGIGEMGTTPMIVSGYPIIALIALNLARRRLRKTEGLQPAPS